MEICILVCVHCTLGGCCGWFLLFSFCSTSCSVHIFSLNSFLGIEGSGLVYLWWRVCYSTFVLSLVLGFVSGQFLVWVGLGVGEGLRLSVVTLLLVRMFLNDLFFL